MRRCGAKSLLVVVVLTCFVAVAANAAVTFDFQTSQGFVDRAAAQTAFGLNNGQMQKRADQVVFSSVQRFTFAVSCASGPAREAIMEISGTVDSAPVPAKGSFDGFSLSGLHDILIADPPPPDVICGGPGTMGAQTGVLRRLLATLGGQSAVVVEEH